MDNIFQTILTLQRKLKNAETNITELNKDAEKMNKQIASELKACYGTIADLKAKIGNLQKNNLNIGTFVYKRRNNLYMCFMFRKSTQCLISPL